MKQADKGLQADARFRVLRLLQDNPEMSQRELARAVGVSLGSLHFVMQALISKGLVKLENFSAAPDKRRYAYLVTQRGIAEKARLTRAFLTRKLKEYEMLQREIEALRAEMAAQDAAAQQDGAGAQPGNRRSKTC